MLTDAEITKKSIIVGALLALIMTAANVYTALKAGRTASASIPAAVLSIAIFRAFKQSSKLENNIVQTIASAGDVVAAGIVFTLPALVIMGYWHSFSYWKTLAIAILGCIMGAAFSVSLRHALIVSHGLQYPVGTATAAIISASSSKTTQASRNLIMSGILGAVITLFQGGFRIFADKITVTLVKKGVIFGFGLSLEPAILAAGFISGSSVAAALLLGVIIKMIAVAIYSYNHIIPLELQNFAYVSDQLRMLSLGAMATGGLCSVIGVFGALSFSLKKISTASNVSREARTARRVQRWVVLGLLCFVAISALALFTIEMGSYTHWLCLMCGAFLVMAFLCSAVGSTIAGNSGFVPLSGFSLMSISLFAFISIPFLGQDASHGAVVVLIMSVALVCVATVTAADTMQDLKAGYILGSTPWKQQCMIILGGIIGALITAPIMQVLLDTYGFINGPQALALPQASMLAAVATAMFDTTVNWSTVAYGATVSITICLIDLLILKRRGARIAALTVALGTYLPIESAMGLVAGAVARALCKKDRTLEASGLLAGSAVTGVILAVIYSITPF